jgi:hypothetical protein
MQTDPESSEFPETEIRLAVTRSETDKSEYAKRRLADKDPATLEQVETTRLPPIETF